MDIFKVCAFAVMSCAAVLLISQREKELSALISSLIYVVVALFAITRTGELYGYIRRSIRLEGEIRYFDVILKSAGVAVVASVASTVCEGTGQKGLAHGIETLAVLEIIYLCMPVFTDLMALAFKIFGD